MTFESSIHRAALLIKSLPKKQAQKLLAMLESTELRSLFKEIRSRQDVPGDSLRLAQQKFIESVSAVQNSSDHVRTHDSEKQQPFRFLESVSQSLLIELLEAEHPSIIATVLAFVSTDLASKILLEFESTMRVSILRRLCQSNKLDEARIQQLSDQLEKRLNHLIDQQRFELSGVEIASKIISCTDALTRESLIDVVASDDHELADQIRERVFVFDEIEQLRDADIKTVLQWTDTSLWAPALQHSTSTLRRKILSNMAERPRAFLSREIDTMAHLDTFVINQARTAVVQTILQLADENRIQLNPHDVADQKAA